MSSSIAIPSRKTDMMSVAAGESASSSSGESSGWAFESYKSAKEDNVSLRPSQANRARKASAMSASLTKAEHTVLDVGNPESPQLITCVKASQGFDWNQEIFLPSYANVNYNDLERKQDPIQDIFVTDEEVAGMFPS
ncbi:hypothetical protein CC80DRAFT_497617 [Byssothecium circinans]|uniref:Uncharacterized protein n=1 Tax=Byssothecium circinans TaxID=147558 RepID=A0A6A5T9F9_9PLEO|nr:hypothetical protein CC80DRAFT_497617 [Byssothecium circinans]